MNTWFFILTIVFILVSSGMILIILVQRPSGGGLAGAFGGAGGGGTDTVFGGRVGDALTWATVCLFAVYLLIAVALNLVGAAPAPAPVATPGIGASSEPIDETSGGIPDSLGSTGIPASTDPAPTEGDDAATGEEGTPAGDGGAGDGEEEATEGGTGGEGGTEETGSGGG